MDSINELKNKGYFVAEVDGEQCSDLNSFLNEVAIAFEFPDYYGKNVNALWDCLGDLSWLDATNYLLVIRKSVFFLRHESGETKKEIMELLSKISDDWNSVPNFNGEEQFRKRSDFRIIYD